MTKEDAAKTFLTLPVSFIEEIVKDQINQPYSTEKRQAIKKLMTTVFSKRNDCDHLMYLLEAFDK